MRFVEMLFAFAEKGYRIEFYQALGGGVGLVVSDEKGECLASYAAKDEDELAAVLANLWRIEG